MKISIIGGSGFIGTRLCYRLSLNKNHDFTVFDIKKSTSFQHRYRFLDVRLSINDPQLISSTALINLAAEHRDDIQPTQLYDQVNVDGAKNVCAVARIRGIQNIIFTSSVAVYGFAKIGTNENGIINPFNDYGRTKWEAEKVYKAWQMEDPKNRTLVIIRPTVIFGERNRGNVFNLLKQIASGKFIMVGSGKNRKSMAYVENVAAFIEYSLNFKPGIHIYNYIDKPDFSMNELVVRVSKILGRSEKITFRLPYIFGLVIGKLFDFIAFVTHKKLAISSIRVRKFCANSVYKSAIVETGFVPPVNLIDALERTVKYEFLEGYKKKPVYYSE